MGYGVGCVDDILVEKAVGGCLLVVLIDMRCINVNKDE